MASAQYPVTGGSSAFTSAITSSVASGSAAMSLTTGQRLDFGGGTSDYLYSNGTGVVTPGSIEADGGYYLGAFALLSDLGAFRLRLAGYATNNISTSVGVSIDSGGPLTATGALIAAFTNNNVQKTTVDKDGNVECLVVGAGFILKSPDGTRYKITVANGGTLSTTAA